MHCVFAPCCFPSFTLSLPQHALFQLTVHPGRLHSAFPLVYLLYVFQWYPAAGSALSITTNTSPLYIALDLGNVQMQDTPVGKRVLSWTHYHQLTNLQSGVESLQSLAANSTSQKVQILNLEFCSAEYIFVMAGKHWQIFDVCLPIGCCCANAREVFQVI